MNDAKEKKTRAIRVAKPQNSADTFISQALATDASIETLERLFALRKEAKAELAKEAYVSALSVFQSECPVIEKTKSVFNKDGRALRYKFAPIDSIVVQIKQPLAKAQLSYRWETKQEPGKVTAICYVTHVI
jgi:hypothetical protein